MKNLEGLVIALDGPDGVGKTEQVKLLGEYFEQIGRKVHLTRNSGGTPIGEALREVSLSTYERPVTTDFYISLAMAAALAEDVTRRKAEGQVIVIDRSPLAMLAYNAYGSEMKDKQPAVDACQKIFKDTGIDLLVFFTAPAAVLEQRRKARNKTDYFEAKGPGYHRRVTEGYSAGLELLGKPLPNNLRIAMIDATPNIESVHRSVREFIQRASPSGSK